MLEDGDAALSDGSLYDLYPLEGAAGDVWIIRMDSDEFDTYVIVVDDQGQTVGENDDAAADTLNSSLTLRLPASGMYRILANAYDAQSRGHYTLIVEPGAIAGDATIPSPDRANALYQQGFQAYRASQYPQAIQLYQEALALYEILGDRSSQGTLSNALGLTYLNTGNYTQSQVFYQQALDLYVALREESDNPDQWRDGLSSALVGLGVNYRAQGRYADSLDSYNQALELAREPGRTPDEIADQRWYEAVILDNIGVVYSSMGQYPQALAQHQQAQAIFQELGDRAEESVSLNNIAAASERLGLYSQAFNAYEEALSIQEELGNVRSQAIILDNLGLLHYNLGQYDESLQNRQQALSLFQQIGDRASEMIALNNLGVVYGQVRNEAEAIASYQQSLAIAQELGDRSSQGVALQNIGLGYFRLGRNSEAEETLKQALTIATEIGVLSGQSGALNGLGLVYSERGEREKALAYFNQALAAYRESGDRRGEIDALSNLGNLVQDDKPELAIVFYKQAVNLAESIRGELSDLSQEQQMGFTNTVADIYRSLTDLLLQQERVLESQQILDLLKLQELDDYFHDVRGSGEDASRVAYWPAEESLIQLHNQSLQELQDYFRLQTIPESTRTPEEEQRLEALEAERNILANSFAQFLNNPTVNTQIEQLKRNAAGQNLNPEQLYSLQDNLRALERKTVLLYPLVLSDRIELVLITPDSPPIRRTIPVSKEALNQAVVDFRVAVTNRNQSSTEEAFQLYQWLIKPLESDLQAVQAETILYAADGVLRYLPIAALYDGDEWLIQRYTINYITAASVTDFTADTATGISRVLAAAYSDPDQRYDFQVGNRSFSFTGLPYAGEEVENIATLFPQTTELLNENFSRTQIEPQLDQYNIVHFATHAEFVSGSPEESFILFGNGDRVTLRDIATWSLQNVDLVVLSACKTAVGGELGNGEEILGFGYQIQRTGARAAIASLWSVDDGGTQALMDAFYAALQQPGVSKADALRQAQVALITGDLSNLNLTDAEQEQMQNFTRPYYWAPFILIGNGL
jgi:CHAT domain-containing protein/Flp pilus assembly protein TadD